MSTEINSELRKGKWKGTVQVANKARNWHWEQDRSGNRKRKEKRRWQKEHFC